MYVLYSIHCVCMFCVCIDWVKPMNINELNCNYFNYKAGILIFINNIILYSILLSLNIFIS